MALKAVSLNGMALQFCPPELQNSPAVVRAALEQTSFAMRYASDEVKASRDVIMAAVSASGKMLVHAHPSLREDEEVVLAAVKQDGMALGYASEELRARSSSQIRANRELVLLDGQQDAKAVQYASTLLQMDPDVQRLVTLGQLRGAVPSHGASAQLVYIVYISTGPPLLCRSLELTNSSTCRCGAWCRAHPARCTRGAARGSRSGARCGGASRRRSSSRDRRALRGPRLRARCRYATRLRVRVRLGGAA